jgi:signal transduction histidine kinase/PAS domain-containing protein
MESKSTIQYRENFGIYQAFLNFLKADSYDAIENLILDWLLSNFNFDFGDFSLIDREQHQLQTLKVKVGKEASDLEDLLKWANGYITPMDSSSILVETLEKKTAIVSKDLKYRFGKIASQKVKVESLTSICAPIISSTGKMIGVLEIGLWERSTNYRKIQKEDIKIVELFSSIFANLFDKLNSITSVAETNDCNMLDVPLEKNLRTIGENLIANLGADTVDWVIADTSTQLAHVNPISLGDHKAATFFSTSKKEILDELLNLKVDVFTDIQDPKVNIFSKNRDIINLGPLNKFSTSESLKTVTVFRLTCGDAMIGVLILGFRSKTSLNESFIKLARIYTNTATLVISHSKVIEEGARRAHEQTTLNRIGRAISSLNNPDASTLAEEVYQILFDEQLIPCDSFYLALYHENSDSIDFAFAVDDGRQQTLNENIWSTRYSGNGVTEYIVNNGVPLILSGDVKTEIISRGIDAIGPMPQAYLGFPLIFSGNVLGVIAVQTYREIYEYTDHDVELMKTVASWVTMSLWNKAKITQLLILLESSTSPIIAFDGNLKVTYVNKAGLGLFNLSMGKVLGTKVTEYFSDSKDLETILKKLLEDNSSNNLRDEVRLKIQSRNEIPILRSIRLITEGRGIINESGVIVLQDLREIHTYKERIQFISEWIDLLHAANEINDLTDAIVLQTSIFVGAEGSALYLVNKVNKTFELNKEIDYLIEEDPKLEISLSNDVFNGVASEKKVVIVEDTNKVNHKIIPGIRKSRSEIIIPLVISSGELLGIMHLINSHPHQFSTQDSDLMPLLDSIGRVAADSIQRITLKNESEKIQKSLQTKEAIGIAGVLAPSVIHQIRRKINLTMADIDHLTTSLQKEANITDKTRDIYLKRLNDLENSLTDIEETSTILLEMARGRNIGSQEPAYLNEVVRKTLKVVNSLAVDKKINIETDYDNNLDRKSSGNLFPIAATEVDVQQILVNLITNAIDATLENKKTGGKIQIVTRKYEDTALLSVQDYGIGMDKDVKERIFKPFFTTKGKGTGTGLGLALCHYLVYDKINGKIEVDTAPFKGTTFSVFFPLADSKT